jgi:hypothetical protein
MKKIIRMTESDLTNLVKRVIEEQSAQIKLVDTVKPAPKQSMGQVIKSVDTVKPAPKQSMGQVIKSVDNVKTSSQLTNKTATEKLGGAIIPGSEQDIKLKLTNFVGAGSGHNYKKICEYCGQLSLDSNNQRAQNAAIEFERAIYGGENPFSNISGNNKESSAYKAGMAIQKNLKTAVDVCTMIKFYKDYAPGDESFCEAVSGELNYKIDSRSNLNLMVGKPIYNIVNKTIR